MYLSLDEDADIEGAPVPGALRAAMDSARAALARGDEYLRVALGEAAMGDGAAMMGELAKVAPLNDAVVASLDRAGLAACRSSEH